jgi:hypothetical protein
MGREGGRQTRQVGEEGTEGPTAADGSGNGRQRQPRAREGGQREWREGEEKACSRALPGPAAACGVARHCRTKIYGAVGPPRQPVVGPGRVTSSHLTHRHA